MAEQSEKKLRPSTKNRLSNQQQRKKYNYYNQLLNPKYTAGNREHIRMFLKSGTSTMLLCKGLSSLAATSLGMYIENYCKKHNSKLEGTFIFTK